MNMMGLFGELAADLYDALEPGITRMLERIETNGKRADQAVESGEELFRRWSIMRKHLDELRNSVQVHKGVVSLHSGKIRKLEMALHDEKCRRSLLESEIDELRQQLAAMTAGQNTPADPTPIKSGNNHSRICCECGKHEGTPENYLGGMAEAFHTAGDQHYCDTCADQAGVDRWTPEEWARASCYMEVMEEDAP